MSLIFNYAMNVAAPESIGTTPEPSDRRAHFRRLIVLVIIGNKSTAEEDRNGIRRTMVRIKLRGTLGLSMAPKTIPHL